MAGHYFSQNTVPHIYTLLRICGVEINGMEEHSVMAKKVVQDVRVTRGADTGSWDTGAPPDTAACSAQPDAGLILIIMY